MAGRNFYYDGDGDGIMDDVGYAYFPEDTYPHQDNHREYHQHRHTYTNSSKGSIFDYISKEKFIKRILIAAGVFFGISIIGWIICFILTIIL